jgi:hypothetical protein
MKPFTRHRAALTSGLVLALAASLPIRTATAGSAPKRPNILFVIMDDVGIDQMQAFGYGGATPPRTDRYTGFRCARTGGVEPARARAAARGAPRA